MTASIILVWVLFTGNSVAGANGYSVGPLMSNLPTQKACLDLARTIKDNYPYQNLLCVGTEIVKGQ
jgi:hypothetical protein